MAQGLHFKRGQTVDYTFAGGQVSRGKVVRLYSAADAARHAKTHGAEAGARLRDWIVCELTDAHGSHRGACHISQLRVVSS